MSAKLDNFSFVLFEESHCAWESPSSPSALRMNVQCAAAAIKSSALSSEKDTFLTLTNVLDAYRPIDAS